MATMSPTVRAARWSRSTTPGGCASGWASRTTCSTWSARSDGMSWMISSPNTPGDALDAPWIATGHYARAAGGVMRRGRDPLKDQSYFLWGIDRAVVERLLLPVGDLTKPDTRARARALGLEV